MSNKEEIKELQEDVKEIENALDCNEYPGRNYVVLISEEAVDPEISKGRFTGNYERKLPHLVTRFKKQQAREIAADMKDRRASVRHWVEACNMHILEIDNKIKALR